MGKANCMRGKEILELNQHKYDGSSSRNIQRRIEEIV